jgi:mannose-6-phosphate isomerase-like protein (cupin superfamily)
MSGYTKVNLTTDVEDMAPKFGMEGMESRFAREALGTEKGALSYFRLAPDLTPPFGHTHAEQEEVYVLLSGSALIRVDSDEVELAPMDAIRVAPGHMRGIAAGSQGCELLAFGAPKTDQRKDAEMVPGWWEQRDGSSS